MRKHRWDQKTAEQVKMCSLLGNSEDATVAICGIDRFILQRVYKEEFEFGRQNLLAQVGRSILKKALSPIHPQSAQCGIFLLKSRGGFKETEAVEVSGAGGGPLVIKRVIVDPADDDSTD
jgi:hypothetical protein